MIELNDTHDPALSSWVKSANTDDNDFPIQNLPFGVFRKVGSGESYRGGVAIGDQILDVGRAADAGLLTGEAASVCKESNLNNLMGLNHHKWSELRHQLSNLLREGGNKNQRYILHSK